MVFMFEKAIGRRLCFLLLNGQSDKILGELSSVLFYLFLESIGFWIIDFVLFLERVYLTLNQNRFLKGRQYYEIVIVGGSETLGSNN